MNTQNSPKLLTPKEVAAQLGVSPVTVRYWAQEKKISFTTTLGGHRRFTQNAIDQFVNQYTTTQASNARILIVDDDQQHAKFLAEFIQKMNLDIDTYIAHDGFEAGQLVYEAKPDLIFLDLMMKEMDGFSVCERIKNKKATENIRVVAMTEFPTLNNINRILKAGAEQCLSKPVDNAVLSEVLLQALNTHIFKIKS